MDNENVVLQEVKYRRSLLTALYKNILAIILAAVLGCLLGLGYGVLTVKPVYTRTSTVMLVAKINSSSSSNNLVLSQYYLSDVGTIIKSAGFVAGANELHKENGGAGVITSSGIGISYGVEDSLIFSISYRDKSDALAESKLKTVIAYAQSSLADYIKADGAELKETSNEMAKSSSYNYFKPSVIGFLLGAIAAVACVVVVYLLDNTVKDREEIEELTGVNVLAFIVKQEDFQTADANSSSGN